ncbi:DUF3105 domain-containing protein [Streptomyces sp. NPDC058001]|uniref:DUF3105 domain-containing protein n=1 Tax=Streptomyces sp. NPDC058001 TaxID=3346300 RepID=UPI0036E9DF3E
MGSAKNTSTPSRKARIEEMRRAERSRDRRNRGLLITGSVIVVAALVAGGALLFSRNSDDGKDGSAQADSKNVGAPTVDKDGVSSWDAKKLTRTHVTKKVTYPMTPPVGGDHDQAWMNCNGDVYENAVPDMNAVHSLEHGAVWVTYNDKAPEADVQKLAEKVKKIPYTLMSPVQGQKDPIMLSAWGKQRSVTGADDPKVDAFFSAYVQGSQTPEQGAACTNGLSK